MAYAYEIKPLDVVGGLPVVPGAHHVSAQVNNYYVAYGDFVNYRGTTLAVIYEDDEGLFLVGAEQNFLDTLDGGETLDSIVSSDPGDWRTYRCGVDYLSNGEGYVRSNGFGDIPKGILVALSVGAPLPLALMPVKFQGALEIFGMQASATHKLAGFDPPGIETDTTWYGDTPG